MNFNPFPAIPRIARGQGISNLRGVYTVYMYIKYRTEDTALESVSNHILDMLPTQLTGTITTSGINKNNLVNYSSKSYKQFTERYILIFAEYW